MSTIMKLRGLAVPLVLLALVGCADNAMPRDTLPRVAVSGTVTLDGQPLPRGTIQFDPVKGAQAPTTFASGEIKEGKFTIDRSLGPVPGQYQVSISSRPPVTIGPDQEPGERPKMEPEKVPAQYNRQTTLTKEVTSSGENAFEFALKGS